MSSILCNEIYSRFYAKTKAYDLLELTDTQLGEFQRSWVRSAISKPNVRRLFSSLLFDTELDEIKYELKYVIDEETDYEFVAELLSIGLIIEWVEPQINNTVNLANAIATKEEKYFKNKINDLETFKDRLKAEQRRLISDRSTVWNTYLDKE